MSPACSIRLVMPERTGDLSGKRFLISCLSSSGVNGAIEKECSSRSLFFYAGKEFGNVLCTFLIIG